jgi:hypothetical protein
LQSYPHSGDTATQQIHIQIVITERARLRHIAGPADERRNPGKQFGKREWLRQVIIRAALKTPKAILHRAPGTQYDHRKGQAAIAQFIDDAQSVHARQHDVDDGRIVGVGQRVAEAFATIIDIGPRHNLLAEVL